MRDRLKVGIVIMGSFEVLMRLLPIVAMFCLPLKRADGPYVQFIFEGLIPSLRSLGWTVIVFWCVLRLYPVVLNGKK